MSWSGSLEPLRSLVRLPAKRRADRRRAVDLAAAREALLRSAETPASEKRLLEEVSLDVHRSDTMYERGRGRHYLSVGLSGLRCIDHAMGPDRTPATVLDFACGYGRVLRFLRVRYPDATITAGEIDPVALRFCTAAFGVGGLLSTESLESLACPDRFDLIWCGSLLTHLDEAAARPLLRFFATHLAPDGVCAASAHGEVTIGALRSGRDRYGLPEADVLGALERYDASGYGYADYPGMRGYGISIASRDELQAMARRAGLRETSFQPSGWDEHHDVYGFTRSAGEGG